MKDLHRAAAALALLMLFSLPAFARSGRMISGKAVEATGGDTLTISIIGNQQQQVRVFGISAPRKGQPLFDIARRHLSDLVSGKDVTLNVRLLDDANNFVATVQVGGFDLGAQMIRDGAAWHYEDEAAQGSSELGRVYAECQEAARKDRRGIWAEPGPTPPWEFARRQAEELAEKDPQGYKDFQREEFENAVRKSKVIVGMDYTDVERAWGFPSQKDSLNNSRGEVVIWRYANARVTFVDGRVTETVLLKDTPRRVRRY